MELDIKEKEKAKQKILETLFEYASLCHVENIISEIEEDRDRYSSDEESYFLEELDKKMQTIIASYGNQTNYKISGKAFKTALLKVVAILVVIFIVTTVFVANVEAIRIKVLNFMMDETEKYTSVDIKEEADVLERISRAIPPDWEGQYAPTYIPEGFRITEAKNYNDTSSIVYLNDARQMILFQKWPRENVNLRIDTEGTDTTSININGFEGLLVEKDDIIRVMWYSDDVLFTISSQIDKNELIKIAESVQLAK